MTKISIITVHKNDFVDLKKTCRSIDNQLLSPYLHIVVANNFSNYQTLSLKKEYRKFIINKDLSIYNAMNIAKKQILNCSVLFLNSGDYFIRNNILINIKKFLNLLKLNYVIIFSTVLKKNKTLFFTKKNYFFKNNYLSHPSFIYYQNRFKKNINYNEKIKISADGLWMKQIIKNSREVKKRFYNITIHNLGGVSTYPTIKSSVNLFKFNTLEGAKEILKYFLRLCIGKYYYNLIYIFKYKKKNDYR